MNQVVEIEKQVIFSPTCYDGTFSCPGYEGGQGEAEVQAADHRAGPGETMVEMVMVMVPIVMVMVLAQVKQI